jgi:hypothetical protein
MANIFMYQNIRYLNIDGTVGINGVNMRDDVSLIQALLYEVLTKRFIGRGAKTPGIPTGVFSQETMQSLNDYKKIKNDAHKKYALGNEKIYYEKHIDPIKGSIFAFKTNQPWALVQLQGDLLDHLIMSGVDSLVESYLYDKYPEMLFMFRR